METLELQHAEAARWVWESLWSTRCHVRMDILDVALFDRRPRAALPTTPIIAQWLFTAKDGRVMKKSSTSASLAALKQSLLGKALRGALSRSENRNSKTGMLSVTVGRPFATAYLSSGETVLVDEKAWSKLIVDGIVHGEEGGDVIAVTAVDPGDSLEFHGGLPQRLVGGYKLKTDYALSQSRGRETFKGPPQATTRTYMLVASGLLRGGEGVDGQSQETQFGELRTTAATKGATDGLLISRAKATNRELETKLRRIVQWVQEVRRVRVLSMNAIFTVLPSSGTGAPGVWLERVISTRVMKSESAVPAPSVNMGLNTPLPNAGQSKNPSSQDELGNVNSQGQSQLVSSPEMRVPSKESESREGLSPKDHPVDSARVHADISEMGRKGSNEVDQVEVLDYSVHDEATFNDNRCENVALPSVLNFRPSVSHMLSDAVKFGLAAGTSNLKHSLEGKEGGRDAAGSLTKKSTSWCRREQLSAKPPEALRTAFNNGCAGDFCGCQETVLLSLPMPKQPQQQQKKQLPPPPSLSSPKENAVNSEETKVVESSERGQVDWTGIRMSRERNVLLEVGQRRALRSATRQQRDDLWYSISNESVCLARREASKGLNAFWGKSLHSFWREGGRSTADGLGGLNPSVFYKEVLVCRTCYDIYGRLDQLRGEVSNRQDSESLSPIDILSRKGSGYTRNAQRQAAANVGAAKLSADLNAMLRDVDARSGKLGIEAGVIWRRRLSKSKSNRGTEHATERRQVRLADRLARPKPRSQPEGGITAPVQGCGRQVKSLCYKSELAGNSNYRRRASAPPGFSTLPRLLDTAMPVLSPQGFSPQMALREESQVPQPSITPSVGLGRRNAWPLRDETVHGTKTDMPADYLSSAVVNSPTMRGGKVIVSPPGSRQMIGCGNAAPNTHTCPQGGVEIDMSGGINIPRRSRSGETIRAIEAMLEGGGAGYLPMCARDLPEAIAVLGSRSMSPKSVRNRDKSNNRNVHRKRGRNITEKEGWDKPKATGESPIPQKDGQTGCDNASSEAGNYQTDGRKFLSDRVRQDTTSERFLHPWQRKLEADKRDKLSSNIDEDLMQLAKDRRRRRQERRAAAGSEHCRRAGRRVAARLGRQRRRFRSRAGGHTAQGRSQHSCIANNAGTNEEPECVGEGNGKIVIGSEYSVEQMRDSLVWARKTMISLVKRLGHKGIDVPPLRSVDELTTPVAGDFKHLVGKLQQHLTSFEDDVATLGTQLISTTAGEATSRVLGQRCDEACEVFESEFCRMIERLISVENVTQLNEVGPPVNPLSTCTATTVAASVSMQQGSRSSHLGLCPSCTILPVSRRCLDCEGDTADRDRCSGCFVRDHREAVRRNHCFLRISIGGSGGSSGSGGGDIGGGGGVENLGTGKGGIMDERRTRMTPEGLIDNTHKANTTASGSRRGDAVRCSKCGDLAASRRCLSCGGLDMCAACHFLTHRSPSRRSHVTEFLGENAVFVQEALHHHRTTAEHNKETGEADVAHSIMSKPASAGKDGSDRATVSPAPVSSVRRNEIKGEGVDSRTHCDGKAGGDGQRDAGVFGKDAVRSLEEVRRTVPPPVVRPLRSAGSSYTENSKTWPETEGQSEVGAKAATDPLDQRTSTSGDLRTVSRAVNDRVGEDMWRGETNIAREDTMHQGGARRDGGEVEESEGAAISEEEDSDDEGMMWSQLNIAKVDLCASDEEPEGMTHPPTVTPRLILGSSDDSSNYRRNDGQQ